MLLRLVGIGVAWLAVLMLFGALLQWSGSQDQVPPGRDGVSALARSLNGSRARLRGGGYAWTVTRAVAFHRELVVDVDAVTPDDAVPIAARLVPRLGGRYDEVLVYVHHVNPKRNARIHRVAWTPGRGYLASTF